ncbi:uncharacterized protein AB675_7105 [Cyphellophora attinorum]|uniref:DUF7730 domain-containing protein n=1 Tax=Cyphellophora attinorum TaxID=1664694 RepID=A0A0N1HEG0_9EURO|nr:uncharacterized protein AB675_7105 [Phialophora attinorum]KPI43366.1 hypothetical protein AB675_7105 [Phialophora attinorum]
MDADMSYGPKGYSDGAVEGADEYQGVLASANVHWTSESTFPFLKLPAEIRNKIYQYLLKAGGEIYVSIHNVRRSSCIRFQSHTDPELLENNVGSWTGTSEPLAAEVPGDGIGLLLTCKEIHREAIVVLYAENKITYIDTFGCFHPRHSSWLKQIGVDNTSSIKDFSIRVPVEELGNSPFTLLECY